MSDSSLGRSSVGSAELVPRLRAAGCVFAEEEAALLLGSAPDSLALEDWVTRRIAGEPLETILGWVWFCGLRIAVAPGVFVPRRRSELLAAEVVRRAPEGGRVVELCAGAAAIATVAAARRPDLTVLAAEVDETAAACARDNLGPGRVVVGDLFAPLPVALRGRVDVLVANAPYVPTGEIAMMPPEARLFEPVVALDGGSDGLDVHRRIAAEMGEWLAPGGVVLIEVAPRQAPTLRVILKAGGCAATEVVSDPEREGTVVAGWLGPTN